MAEIDMTTPWFQLTGNRAFGIFRTWTNGSNVNVLLEIETRSFGIHRLNWKMELQQYTSSATGWQTIGTRTGRVTDDSSSRVTFTNVAKRQRLMRVKITFTDLNVKSFYSGTWGTLPAGVNRPL